MADINTLPNITLDDAVNLLAQGTVLRTLQNEKRKYESIQADITRLTADAEAQALKVAAAQVAADAYGEAIGVAIQSAINNEGE